MRLINLNFKLKRNVDTAPNANLIIFGLPIVIFIPRNVNVYPYSSDMCICIIFLNYCRGIMWTEGNETNALTMPTLITTPDGLPNRRVSGRTNYASS